MLTRERAIADKIFDNLSDRRGVGNELEICDEDVKEEIKNTVAKIILSEMDEPLAVLADRKGMKLSISRPKKEWSIGIRSKGEGTDKKGPIICYHSMLYEGADIYTRAYLEGLPDVGKEER